MPGTDSYSIDPYNGKDAVSNGGRLAPGDPSRRAFAYFMMGSARYVSLSLLLELCACFGRTAARRIAPLAVFCVPTWGKNLESLQRAVYLSYVYGMISILSTVIG